ncbi:MAG: DUF2189 domain-containing protein [Pseudomonadota bacterium]
MASSENPVPKSAQPLPVQPRSLFQALQVREVTPQDVKDALRAGVIDFLRRPVLSSFFGVVYAVFGLVFILGLLVFDKVWMTVPAGVGFPLIAPFMAVGLYEMSRRYKAGEAFTWSQIFTVIFKQQRREFGWMAFVTLFVFWIWMYQIRLLLALFLQWQSFSTLDGLVTIITTTTNGMLFLGVGTIVGALLATALFSLTVISMPLLLDKNIDFVSAMIISVKTVQASPLVMLGWGATIAVLVFVALLPAFLGVIIVLPILGHATWHLYRRAIDDSALTAQEG